MKKKLLIISNIGGTEPTEVEYAEVDISFLKLDLKNPRFKHKKFTSESELEKAIWIESSTRELFLSILESKGISEPLFIREDGTVVEGNRRVVCLRKLKEGIGTEFVVFPKEGYQKIPVYIIPKKIPPVTVDILLARLHVAGKKQWSALNQAEHVYNLRMRHKLTFDKIARLLPMGKGKVLQKFWSYKETKEFLDRYSAQSIQTYSFFEEAYKKKNIREFVESNRGKIEFYQWILNEKFNETGAKDIRKFSDFFENEKLINIFKTKGFKDASLEYELQKRELGPFIDGIKNLNLILDKASEEDIEKFKPELLKLSSKLQKLLR